jgi:hypothetical protein
MVKSERFYGIQFDTRAIQELEKAFRAIATAGGEDGVRDSGGRDGRCSLALRLGSRILWAAGQPKSEPTLEMRSKDFKYSLDFKMEGRGEAVLTVRAPKRDEIEAVFKGLEDSMNRCRIPDWENEEDEKPVKIFIGHSHDDQWKLLKDHLHEKHHYAVEAYEIGARAGHAVRDILTYMLEGGSLAFLVMTGEDKMAHGKMAARQNVVHEAELFQGKARF